MFLLELCAPWPDCETEISMSAGWKQVYSVDIDGLLSWMAHHGEDNTGNGKLKEGARISSKEAFHEDHIQ